MTENEILLEILRWTKVTSFSNVRQTLLQALPSQSDRLIYSLSNGEATISEIKLGAKVGAKRIQTVWANCCAIGLMERMENGRAKSLFSLADFSLESVDTGSDSDE